jgi:formylglycine-generating enzyme required for sulfatase activity
MIDETFLRQTAALQANLKMLESQQDALSDFQDMQALRQYKARLVDYIEAHSNAGNLPTNPFQVIQQRLIAVSESFTSAEQEYKRFTSWKKGWIKGISNISLSDIQSAKTELSHLVAELPHVQQRLWQMISQLDWDTSSSTVDLHTELLACAQCVDGLNLSKKAESRHDLYQFARCEGKLANAVSSHLTAMGMRIDELISLHEKHQALLAEAEAHLANENFRSAERAMQTLDTRAFADIDYQKVDSLLQRQLAEWRKFADLEAQVNASNYKELHGKLRKAKETHVKAGSELATEISELTQKVERTIDAHRQARKKSLMTKSIVIFLIVVVIGSLSAFVIQEEKKAKLVAAEAKARAEQEAAEAKAKAEQEAAEARARAEQEAAEARAKLPTEIYAGRVGATLGVPLSGKLVMPFAFCPAGSFKMGSPESEVDRSDDENQVSVTLSKSFWMAKTEVTQAQWRAVMGSDPSYFKGDDLPVEEVSWDDAQKFIKKVNDSGVIPEGWKVALPSEAQWEYACRADETGPYSGGTIEQVAWYDGNSGSKTQPVGTKKPNAWGLYDMHGNVWEWCADWYDDSLSGGTDPTGPSLGVLRVYRGGSWDYDAAGCRAADRYRFNPVYRFDYLGFRPALVPSE